MPAYLSAVIDGGYTTVAETWSVGLNFTSDGTAPTPATLSAWGEAIRTWLEGSAPEAQQLRQSLSTVGTIERVRTYFYASVGAPAAAAGVSTGSRITGSGTVSMPLQVCRVYSLLTGVPGGSYRGRIYWPTPATSIGSTFKNTAVGQSMAANFATALGVFATAAPSGVPSKPAVVSQAKGVVTTVTSVRVGDVLDTQRRRRDALVETYYTAPVA